MAGEAFQIEVGYPFSGRGRPRPNGEQVEDSSVFKTAVLGEPSRH